MKARRLVPAARPSYLSAMLLRSPIVLAVLLAAAPALAAPAGKTPTAKSQAAPPAPKEIGHFGHWIAASYVQAGQTVCYAFTRAGSDDPATGNGPILTVTDRPGSRDEVAISGAPAFPKDFTLPVSAASANLDFYTSGHDAFARDNKAAVGAMLPASAAVAHLPGKGGALTFSLEGFKAAHDAIDKACR